MPPKIFKKDQNKVSHSGPINASSSEKKGQDNLQIKIVFMNPKNVMLNIKILQRIRILISLLSGIISGLLNVNQLIGPFIYVGLHLLITFLVSLKIGKVQNYFNKKSDIFNGMGSGVLIFLCAWMIIYNIVYTL